MFKWFGNALYLLILFALGPESVTWAAQAELSGLPFQTELGFNRISDSSTPDFLKNASFSVFKIIVPFEEKPDDLKFYDLTDPTMIKWEASLDSLPGVDPQLKIVVRMQLQFCRKQGIGKNCPVILNMSEGTAFLADGNGSTLWTAAHVVDGFLKLSSAFKKTSSVVELLKRDKHVAVFIFDLNGKLVYNPLEKLANIIVYAQPSNFALLGHDWYAQDTDYVGIKLDHAIGVPLRIGRSPTPDQALYTSGFPGCTGCSENPNANDPLDNMDRGLGKNSSGKEIYWTFGKLQTVNTANTFLGGGALFLLETKQMLFFSADLQVGFSGGPILNGSGEVVGVVTGSKPKLYDQTLLSLSSGVRPQTFDKTVSK